MAHHGLCDSFTRKKPAEVWPLDSPLRRCLTVVDLTSLGVGTVVGAGLYVVTGELARDATGPAVVLSFLLASVAALLCVFSYAEYGCRVPKAGSAYVYTYITLGEIWAFIIGWTVVLEYIIAGASLARACSEYIDTLFQGEIYQFFMHNVATWNHPGLAPFPDFLAAAIVVVVVILLSYGVRISVNVQKAVTIGNIVVILFMIIYGLFFANFKNWTRKFASYGIHGVLQGAAGAFFAFSGFDVVTIAAEEVINPQRNIPLSLILVITISTLAYLGVTAVLTLALSYKELEAFAPLAKAFAQVGNFPAAQYIIACGGICATFSSLVCVVFSSSRIVFSMSVDGLFFRWFAHVNDPTHSPIGATIITGCLTAVFALIFDIKQLVELLSIGTLLAYAMVTICVLVSRYETGVQSVDENGIMGTKARTRKWLESLSLTSDIFEDHSYAMATYQSITTRENTPNEDSGERVKAKAIPGSVCFYKVSVFCLVAGITGLVVVLSSAFDYIIKPEWWAIFLVCLFSGTAVVSLVSLQLQPQNNATFSFMVPGVPYIPAISIFINVLLMANLQWMTYARFGAWMAVGLIIYFLYGYHHSIEAIKPTSHSKGEFVLPEMPEFQGFVKKPQMRQ